MGPVAVKKLTYQDYLKIPEDNLRHEIIDGEHFVTPSPMTNHQDVSAQLFFIIFQWIKKHNPGKLLAAPFDVILSRNNIVVTDIIYISKAHLSVVTEKNIQGAPDFIIEILSPSTSKRDLGIKKNIYETSGVEHYWIVDPDQKTIQTFHLENSRYVLLSAFNLREPLTSSLFPRLSISMTFLVEYQPSTT